MSIALLCVLFGTTPESKAASVAAWHFDETSGSNASDSVGTVNGALVGDVCELADGDGFVHHDGAVDFLMP